MQDERSDEATAGRPRGFGPFRPLAWVAGGLSVGLVAVAIAVLLLGDNRDARDRFEPSAVASGSPTLGPVSGEESAPLPDETLPAFADGQPVTLADYSGRPLVINFWATWCAPCVEEMPILERVSRQVDDEVVFLGINVQDQADKAEDFLEDVNVTYDQASDPQAEFFAQVEAFGMPTTLFVDASGTVRYRHTGILDEDQLTDLLGQHLDVDA